MKILAQTFLLILPLFFYGQTDTLLTKSTASGEEIVIEFLKGKHHNHPLMAIWVEGANSNYIETLYVAKSIATSIFGYGDESEGVWKPGMVRRPAALPYWSHKRGIQADDGLFLPTPDNPVPDAISGPTPVGDFILRSKIDFDEKDTIRILLEINQSWDWNEYWTNNKYPDDENYKTSSQPSVIYETVLLKDKNNAEISFKPIGHGHHSGKNGNLYTDLSSLTTALEIIGSITVQVQ